MVRQAHHARHCTLSLSKGQSNDLWISDFLNRDLDFEFRMVRLCSPQVLDFEIRREHSVERFYYHEPRSMMQDARHLIYDDHATYLPRRVSRWANAIRPYTPNCQLSTENSHPPVCSLATHTQSLLLLSQTTSHRMSLHRTLPAHPSDHYWQ